MVGWMELFERAIRDNPVAGCRIVTAYNMVVDRVHELKDDEIDRLPSVVTEPKPKDLSSIDEFSALLDKCMKNGVGHEAHAKDRLFEHLEERYGYTDRVGGQGAIVGTMISRLAGRSAAVHPDRLDECLVGLLKEEDLLVPVESEGGTGLVRPAEALSEQRSERHLIFEFKEGQRSVSGASVPRGNRLIIDPISSIRVDDAFEKALPMLARDCDVFFAAGLDHMGEDFAPAFRRVASHARTVSKASPDAVLHLEATCMRDRRKVKMMLSEVLPHFDSLGLNEAELASIHAVRKGEFASPQAGMSPQEQVGAMECLLDTGVRRVHMHTLGYHLRTGATRDVEASLRAMAFSAAVACAAASKGALPRREDLHELRPLPSREGLKVLDHLSSKLAHSTEGSGLPGNLEGVICLPAPIIEKPRLTVGLGDCISGSCIAAEKMLGAL